MLKIVAFVTLGSTLAFGTAAGASPRMITPAGPPLSQYALPGTADDPANGLTEGRSIYRMEDPATFYDGSDEQGYQSGNPQNPRTGN